MKWIAMACVLSSAGTVWLGGLQDPQKPAPPVPVQVPVPVAAPAGKPATPVPRPLEGVYELRSRTVAGIAETQPGRGYVAITKRHMLLCFVVPGTDPDSPLLRGGVRTWKPDRDDLVRTEQKLGFFTDAGGAIKLDSPGTSEVKKIDVERGRLRIWQDDRSYMEFERIE